MMWRALSLAHSPRVPEASERPGATHVAQPTVATLRDPRLPPPGTVLRKDYGSQVHEVVVGDNECIYAGVRYRSLSAVAVKIYGGQVNGYAFFARALRESQSARPAQAGAL